jgi:hypothetical protein
MIWVEISNFHIPWQYDFNRSTMSKPYLTSWVFSYSYWYPGWYPNTTYILVQHWVEPIVDWAKKTIGGNWCYQDLFLSVFPSLFWIKNGVVLYYENNSFHPITHLIEFVFPQVVIGSIKTYFQSVIEIYRKDSSILPWNMSNQVVLLNGID